MDINFETLVRRMRIFRERHCTGDKEPSLSFLGELLWTLGLENSYDFKLTPRDVVPCEADVEPDSVREGPEA